MITFLYYCVLVHASNNNDQFLFFFEYLTLCWFVSFIVFHLKWQAIRSNIQAHLSPTWVVNAPTFSCFFSIIFGFQLKGINLGSEALGTHGLHSIIWHSKCITVIPFQRTGTTIVGRTTTVGKILFHFTFCSSTNLTLIPEASLLV